MIIDFVLTLGLISCYLLPIGAVSYVALKILGRKKGIDFFSDEDDF